MQENVFSLSKMAGYRPWEDLMGVSQYSDRSLFPKGFYDKWSLFQTVIYSQRVLFQKVINSQRFLFQKVIIPTPKD